jgi:hypothetical protein
MDKEIVLKQRAFSSYGVQALLYLKTTVELGFHIQPVSAGTSWWES